MVFSAPIFLYGFLPLVLLAYFLSPKSAKNAVLLAASLLFYAWGEVFYLAVMLVSIAANYLVGLALERHKDFQQKRRRIITIGVAINLLLLVSFKYANFISDNVAVVTRALGLGEYDLAPVHLPLGISFFTFQAISYIVDVYRGNAEVQRNPFHFALYVSLFPQLIAGPIVRYTTIADQIKDRTTTVDLFYNGSRRFIYGLAKKVLIANSLGAVADACFAVPEGELSMIAAWVGIIAYSLQIYFDFSGYSDMAIGLGMMFGFKFLENFNYPYISRSIQEFWRRWHISLSTWFRDYVYISLGGNRVSPARVYLNLLIVFILTGFWHGASWNFLVWGLFHGAFLVIERAGFSNILARSPAALRHGYVLFVVVIGWVFFRAENLSAALDYLGVMFGSQSLAMTGFEWAELMTSEALIAMVLGLILSTPIYRWFEERRSAQLAVGRLKLAVAEQVFLGGLLLLTLFKVASSTYDPFIYFRF